MKLFDLRSLLIECVCTTRSSGVKEEEEEEEKNASLPTKHLFYMPTFLF